MKTILEFDTTFENWTEIGELKNKRSGHGISLLPRAELYPYRIF